MFQGLPMSAKVRKLTLIECSAYSSLRSNARRRRILRWPTTRLHEWRKAIECHDCTCPVLAARLSADRSGASAEEGQRWVFQSASHASTEDWSHRGLPVIVQRVHDDYDNSNTTRALHGFGGLLCRDRNHSCGFRRIWRTLIPELDVITLLFDIK